MYFSDRDISQNTYNKHDMPDIYDDRSTKPNYHDVSLNLLYYNCNLKYGNVGEYDDSILSNNVKTYYLTRFDIYQE